jgi:hypothetical protein
MWKYLVLCFVMLGWAFFEMSGGQDFKPTRGTAVAVIDAIDSDPDPIERSFDQEEVARAATDALRSIDFDDEQDTVTRALTITDAQVWKVSSEARIQRCYRKFVGLCRASCCGTSAKN